MNQSLELASVSSVHQFHIPETDLKKFSPVIKRGGEIIGSLMIGAFKGYIFYWMTRLLEKVGIILGMMKETNASIHPLPCVLSGVISAALVETAYLVYHATLYVLGSNQNEKLENSEKTSSVDYLRQHTWKMIVRLEKLLQDIDVIYSRFFHIRTAKEIRQNYKTDQDYYLCKPKFMEITRRAFWEQVHETTMIVIPQELGIYAVEALGFTFLNSHLFIWLHEVTFFSELINKIGKVYQQIYALEVAEAEKQELENKIYNDILTALFPAEIAELEIRENEEKETIITHDEMQIEDEIEWEETNSNEEIDEIKENILHDNFILVELE